MTKKDKGKNKDNDKESKSEDKNAERIEEIKKEAAEDASEYYSQGDSEPDNPEEDFKAPVPPVDPKQENISFLKTTAFLGFGLAGLAAIAERPDRIFNLFMLQEINEMKYFSVKMMFRGKWRIIGIDDYIPFAFDAPAFSQSNRNELWVIILEKAWAKIYGSYKQI